MNETLSFVRGNTDVPLLQETIGQNLRRTVNAFPDREALVVRHQGFRLTYRELWNLSTKAAKGLMALGVQSGDRVGIWSPNRYEWVVTQFATARIGAILVNINPAYKADELKFALNQSGVGVLLLAAGFRNTDYPEILRKVAAQCPHLRLPVVLEAGWERLLARHTEISDATLGEREMGLHWDDPINIQYTSGTTGRPKGATLTHFNILNNAFLVGKRQGFSHEDRVCIPVPFYHCFGMVLGNLACATHGACMVIPSESFDPLAVLETVSVEKCTALYGVPTMFLAVLDHPRFKEFKKDSLRTGIMAGALCPKALLDRVLNQLNMKEFTVCYGQTETAPVSTQTLPDDPEVLRVTTVGSVQDHTEIKVVDPETGITLPRNTAGELCTRGYCVMKGYWNDEAHTADTIDGEGWLHSGDLAEMDSAGYLRIVGRLKDMIIRGENIYPKEIEDYLFSHPKVAEAQVVGVPSEKYGEEVMAWIRPEPGSGLTEADLLDFCQGHIATFKIPKFWKFVEAFPLTITGKIQKFILREEGAREIQRREP